MTLDQIEILSDDDGAPRVSIQYSVFSNQLPIHQFTNNQFTLSISHSGNRAFCALVDKPGFPLGADIEKIDERTDEFVRDTFVREEIALVEAAPPSVKAGIATAIWSAKESALKAIRLGFTVEPFVIKCLPQGDGQKDWDPVSIEWDVQKLRRTAPALNGWWCEQDGFVMTIAAGGIG